MIKSFLSPSEIAWPHFNPVLNSAYNPDFQFVWLGFIKKHRGNCLPSFFSLRQTDEREAFD